MRGGNKPSMGCGSARVLTGFRGCFFQLPPSRKLPFFTFCDALFAEKVLRRLAKTNFLKSNIQLPEIGVQIPTTGGWKLEVGSSKSDFLLPEIGIRLPTLNPRNSDSNFQHSEDRFQLPTTDIWKLEGGNWKSNFSLLRFQVSYAFLYGERIEAAGRPHVFLVGGKE